MTTLLDLMPDVELAEPHVAGPLAVFPVFGPAPDLEYVSFAEGAARGVTVTELPGGASVNDVLVVNPLEIAVLLFEGEELRGAQQDRTVDGAVLVPGGTKVDVPVSCVEQGRWDGRRHAEPFVCSPDAAFPALRAAKSARMREAMAASAPARADQGEVWDMVGPGPLADSFTGVDAGGIIRRDRQLGAVAAIGDRFLVLDFVSRPDAWAALHGPLTRGYALDASRGASGATPTADAAWEWLASQTAVRAERAPSTGLGERVHCAGATGLVAGDELVQLSVYAVDELRH